MRSFNNFTRKPSGKTNGECVIVSLTLLHICYISYFDDAPAIDENICKLLWWPTSLLVLSDVWCVIWRRLIISIYDTFWNFSNDGIMNLFKCFAFIAVVRRPYNSVFAVWGGWSVFIIIVCGFDDAFIILHHFKFIHYIQMYCFEHL